MIVSDQAKRETFNICITDEGGIDSKCSNNPVMSDRLSTLHRTKHRILRRTDSLRIIIGSMVIMIRTPKGIFRPYYPKVTFLVFERCEKSALVAKTERWPDDPPFEVTQTHRMFCFSQFKKILRPVDLACIGLPRKINSSNLTVQDQR